MHLKRTYNTPRDYMGLMLNLEPRPARETIRGLILYGTEGRYLKVKFHPITRSLFIKKASRKSLSKVQ